MRHNGERLRQALSPVALMKPPGSLYPYGNYVSQPLHVKKILYHNIRESQLDTSLASLDDDDDRLVIDLVDDDDDVRTATVMKRPAPADDCTIKRNQMMAQRRRMRNSVCVSHVTRRTEHHEHRNPRIERSIRESNQSKPIEVPSIIYLNNSSLDNRSDSLNSVKIDILPTAASTQLPALMNALTSPITYKTPTSLHQPEGHVDDLGIINTEIDNLIGYKTNMIGGLLSDYVSEKLSYLEFAKKMKTCSDVTFNDLYLITRNLIKKFHFFINKNYMDFSKIKHLTFPTSAHHLICYFESCKQHLNRQQLVDTLKFYQIIIKELLNLNKTKIIQYLFDFMIVPTKNANLDVLNLSYKEGMGIKPLNPSPKAVTATITSPVVNYTKQQQTASRYNIDVANLCNINRANLIYTTARAKNTTKLKYACGVKSSSREQACRPLKRMKSPVPEKPNIPKIPNLLPNLPILQSPQNSAPEKRRKLMPLLPKTSDQLQQFESNGYSNQPLQYPPPYTFKPPNPSQQINPVPTAQLQIQQIQLTPPSPPAPRITHHPSRTAVTSPSRVPLPAHIPHLQLPPAHVTQHVMQHEIAQDLHSHHQNQQNIQNMTSRKLGARYKIEQPKYVEPIPSHSPFYPYPYYPYMWPMYENAPYAPPSAMNAAYSYYPSYFHVPQTSTATVPSAFEVPYNTNAGISGLSSGINGGINKSYYRPF